MVVRLPPQFNGSRTRPNSRCTHRSSRYRSILAATLLGGLLAASVVSRAAADEPCRLEPAEQRTFLPKTAAPENLRPLASPGQPLPDDCGFYKWAWQAFLYATQPTAGKVAFLSWPTFEDVFKAKESPLFADQKPNLLSLAPRSSKVSNKDESSHFRMSDLLQAGSQQVLVDPRGNVVWYAIHLNKTYQSFIEDYGLRDRKTLDNQPRELAFRTGSVEMKSAWQIIEGAPPKNYITAKALVPAFRTTSSGEIVKDGDKTRVVTVALLGIHVVGTIEGHPEFIWSTFEHVSHKDKAWVRDVAPAAKVNPEVNKPVLVDQRATAYSLYPASPLGPPVANANSGNGIYNLKLDAKTQTFSPTSTVYRQFPGSKSDESVEDDAVTSLNEDMQKLFGELAPGDLRSNYQLVGAIWLNTPEDDFKAGLNFMDAAAKPRKQPLFGGEDRLSSTTMESFTQSADSFPNCFACHNTESVSGVQPSRLNVSHAPSKFYSLEEMKVAERTPETSAAKDSTSAPTDSKGSPGAAATAPGSEASGQLIQANWEKQLVAHIDRYKGYAATRSSAPAKIVVAFTLDRLGHVVAARLQQSSGNPAVDRAALTMMRKADPVPPPPPVVADKGLNFSIPVTFEGRGK